MCNAQIPTGVIPLSGLLLHLATEIFWERTWAGRAWLNITDAARVGDQSEASRGNGSLTFGE